MRHRRVMTWLVFGAMALAVLWGALRLPVPGAQEAGVRVVRVVDGDTIEVRRDGTPVTVRLLNVNTPETVAPNKPVECGGPKASEWLKHRLPPGEVVTLTYDVERSDRYGRDLARVSTADGRVVNDEILASGLGRAIAVGVNRAWYPQAMAAQEAARTARTGLFDPASGCPTPEPQRHRSSPAR